MLFYTMNNINFESKFVPSKTLSKYKSFPLLEDESFFRLSIFLHSICLISAKI